MRGLGGRFTDKFAMHSKPKPSEILFFSIFKFILLETGAITIVLALDDAFLYFCFGEDMSSSIMD